MDISPLYQLRERLKIAMISGSDLIAEDFRLRRAAENIRPLENVSPVFARLNQLLGVLLAEECKDRESVLLDAITLVDAVLCTQASEEVPGVVEEVEVFSCGKVGVEIPYSIFSNAMLTLKNPGKERHRLLRKARDAHPEIFEDYRFKAAMVDALGNVYVDMAEMLEQWLIESGEPVVPLLKRNFDPKGKKEMVRRVRIMDAVSGGKLNDFYLEQLPEAGNSVRRELIYALRHCDKNVGDLITMTRTEKGKAKKMAYWTLADMESREAEQFFLEFLEKNLSDALGCLKGAKSKWAADLVAEKLMELMDIWCSENVMDYRTKESKIAASLLLEYFYAMIGKRGEQICNCYRKAAKCIEKIDDFVVNWYEFSFRADPDGSRYDLQKATQFLPKLLMQSIKVSRDKGLARLAVELYETYGMAYFAAACTGMQELAEGNELYEWLESKLINRNMKGKQINMALLDKLEESLHEIRWDDRQNCYVRWFWIRDERDGRKKEVNYPVDQPFGGPITDLLMACKKNTLDQLLFCWIRKDDQEYCEKLGAYFKQRALTAPNNECYLTPMCKCKVQDCSGLAVQYAKSQGDIYGWRMRFYLDEMPGSNEAKLKEAKAVYELICWGKVKGVRLKETLEGYIARMEQVCGRNIVLNP